MVKYIDYHGVCPWCGHPFKDGLIEVHVSVAFKWDIGAMYEIDYLYTCHECGNETVVARDITNATNSELAYAAGKASDKVRKEVERHDKLHS